MVASDEFNLGICRFTEQPVPVDSNNKKAPFEALFYYNVVIAF